MFPKSFKLIKRFAIISNIDYWRSSDIDIDHWRSPVVYVSNNSNDNVKTTKCFFQIYDLTYLGCSFTIKF